jgi:hypothetical protein
MPLFRVQNLQHGVCDELAQTAFCDYKEATYVRAERLSDWVQG